MGFLPPHYRRQVKLLKYTINVLSNQSNPNYPAFNLPLYQNTFRHSQGQILPIPIQAKNILSDLNLTMITQNSYSSIPIYTHPPLINLELTSCSKTDTPPELFKIKLRTILSQYPDYIKIFTDGSKESGKVGSAFVCPDKNICEKQRLIEYSSNYSAELCALKMALKFVENNVNNNFLILSDSKSALQSIKNLYPTNSYVKDIHKILYKIQELNKNVTFIWIPSHIGILGNEEADAKAKEASEFQLQTVDDSTVSPEDTKHFINTTIFQKWYEDWENIQNNKLRKIQQTPTYWKPKVKLNRKQQVIISRLRLGHTKLTHKHIYEKTPPPNCDVCDIPLSVEHILCECTKFNIERIQYGIPRDITNVFEIDILKLLGYLENTNLLDEI
ncbi:uncharacterized protein LOC116169121 [Photinus pyralis]|uniref:uncharacterized protein LOC116169121 n=1 Tax=Photinus pyralis TaxID=7054 RepID=UPI001267321F|nr:uncharacterized protein LOC116169121 [Photinus pyralis]